MELHDDHFPSRTKDTEWLGEVARRGVVADQVGAFLTALRRIRNIANSEPPPFIARVLPSGEVKVLTELKRAWKRAQGARGGPAGR